MRLIKCNLADGVDAACCHEISWNVSRDMHWYIPHCHIVSLLFEPAHSFFFGLTALAAEPSSARKAIIPQRSQKGEASKTYMQRLTIVFYSTLGTFELSKAPKSQVKLVLKLLTAGTIGDGTLATPPRRTRNGPLAWAHDATGIGAPLQCQNDATTATGESRRARRLPVPSLEINKASISVDSRDRMGPLFSFDIFVRVCHVIPC